MSVGAIRRYSVGWSSGDHPGPCMDDDDQGDYVEHQPWMDDAAALLDDRKRLEWMMENGAAVTRSYGSWSCIAEGEEFGGYGITPREAIDNAMKRSAP